MHDLSFINQEWLIDLLKGSKSICNSVSRELYCLYTETEIQSLYISFVNRGSSGTRQNSQTDSTIVRILRLKKIITGKIFHAKTWYYVGTEPLMLATLPLCTATLMACSRKLVALLSLKLLAILWPTSLMNLRLSVPQDPRVSIATG